MYLVQLAGVAEARWLCGPSSPLADPDRRPLTGFAEHLGGGLVCLDGDAVQALAALPPHADGWAEWTDAGPVLHFGRDVFLLEEDRFPVANPHVTGRSPRGA